MAILKSVIDVNNGNTGWDRGDVLDALETVFANLGWHGGTASTGVPCGAISPTGDEDNYWYTVAREPGSVTREYRYFDVKNIDTTSYRVLERRYLYPFSYSRMANSETDEIEFRRKHRLQTGDAIHWAPGETDELKNLEGLTLDTVYYAIVVDNYKIKLATNATNAANGIAIDLLYGGYTTDSAVKSSNQSYFKDPDTSDFDNATIVVGTGDVINFTIDDQSGGTFNICGNTDSYSADKRLYVLWDSLSGTTSAFRPDDNISSGTFEFNTRYWRQTENEPSIPTELQPPRLSNNPWNYNRYKYIYASSVNSSMKGEIVIEPNRSNDAGWDPYWKYTIPSSGSRSELKLKVYRDASVNSRISDIDILSIGSGWTEGETFTIPGDQIGGITPDDDISFGTSTPETSSGAGDGIAEILITDLGAGSSFYQKSKHGKFAILKNINQSNKTYGTTYYGFSMDRSNIYRMYINSGSNWRWFNKPGVNSPQSETADSDLGFFSGIVGLDVQANTNYLNTYSNTDYTYINIASSSTPTAYPLSIRVYRAQAPQDSNFAIIQFAQTINGEIVPYGTFTIHRGALFGSGIWDLDDVYLGSISTYTTYTSTSSNVGAIDMRYVMPGYYNSTINRPTTEPINSYSKAGESSYGYRRDPEYGNSYILSRYASNISSKNSYDNELLMYYRNSTYDRIGDYSINSNADYYKPIKGLPICNSFIPCPYYLPDDFVMLQVSTSPGLTQFRPGDTVTVSPSEIYEIILAGYLTQRTGLDGIDSNSSIGMLFMARTT